MIRTVTAVPPQVFAHATTAPDAALMQPVVTVRGWNKPQGGLWTTDADSEGWAEWCRAEDWNDPETLALYRLTVLGPVEVAVIDSLADLEAIIAEYGYRSFLGDVIDYGRMARDGWDGIRLTDEGQWATRLTKPGLYGWDLGCTLWMRWTFDTATVAV